MSATSTKTLYQRLAAVAADLPALHPTGRTQQGQPTLSIADVEDALRPLLARHGVVTGYSFNTAPVVVHAYKTERGGTVETHQVDLTVWLVNADHPEDRREDRIIDHGSNPSAAVSFALKRYFRALFHLADDDEREASDKKPAPTPHRRAQPAGPRAGDTRSPQEPGTGPVGTHAERAQALERLMVLRDKVGWDAQALKDMARKMFGKDNRDELTVEELIHLGDKIETLLLARAP